MPVSRDLVGLKGPLVALNEKLQGPNEGASPVGLGFEFEERLASKQSLIGMRSSEHTRFRVSKSHVLES